MTILGFIREYMYIVWVLPRVDTTNIVNPTINIIIILPVDNFSVTEFSVGDPYF